MPSIAYKIAHRRVLVVEEVVDEWQIDHERAKLACDTDELVRETTDLLKPMERVVTHLDDNLKSEIGDNNDPTRLLVVAHLVGCLLNKALDLFPKVKCIIEDIQRLGYTVDGVSGFEKARSALTNLRDTFYKTWSLPDEKTLKMAKQEIRLGNYRVL